MVSSEDARRYGCRMPRVLLHIGVGLVSVALVACGDGGASRSDALASRVDAIDKRLAAIEKNADGVDRLRNDSASLDRRLSSLESSVRELAARPSPNAAAAPPAPAPGMTPPTEHRAPSSGPGAWSNPTTRLDRTQRRAELRALSDQFRARLSEMQGQPGGNDPEQARKVLDWYRDQRRAILRGDGRTDQ
jgi:hypothetical protein